MRDLSKKVIIIYAITGGVHTPTLPDKQYDRVS